MKTMMLLLLCSSFLISACSGQEKTAVTEVLDRDFEGLLISKIYEVESPFQEGATASVDEIIEEPKQINAVKKIISDVPFQPIAKDQVVKKLLHKRPEYTVIFIEDLSESGPVDTGFWISEEGFIVHPTREETYYIHRDVGRLFEEILEVLDVELVVPADEL
ncbi:hypothetical protein [Alkalihalobacterium chitinilyticum]|uniref:Lipoprotein n=1 Tax=Alkalihalobacterium chitinilyticum TaxID=2980103 RepID=A0ABT5VL30_9BACI|nr:hypothetical protein [Alkalihalobacterium chitinilyticum]MDE5416156.1 hypothetical protein [Alkalihalobacterium chitinilyticum]